MISVFERAVSRKLLILGLIAASTLAMWPAMRLHAANDQRDFSIVEQWKLTSVLDFAEVSALDDKEAKQLVGKVLTIRRNKVQLGDRVCSAPGL